MKETDIHKAIDLYFDAQLSIKEEEELFHTLLSYRGKDPKADEALAVMLMTRKPNALSKSSKPRRANKARIWRAAAAVAVIAGACTMVLWHNEHLDSQSEGMMAYIKGVKISDQTEIMKIVDEQLNDISISSELFAHTVTSDLDDIRDAFNEEEI